MLIHSRVQRPIDIRSWIQSLIHRSHRTAAKYQFVVSLPWCNINSKLQISGKSKDLTVKSRTEPHLRQANISRALLSRKNRLRSETNWHILVYFRSYLFEATGPNWSDENNRQKHLLIAKTAAKQRWSSSRLMTSLHCGHDLIYPVGFHMTSLKFKLKNYRSYRVFTFTMH